MSNNLAILLYHLQIPQDAEARGGQLADHAADTAVHSLRLLEEQHTGADDL